MDFNKKIREITKSLNEKNYDEIKPSLFSSNKQICIFCLDALKTDFSLINLHDLIDLFKQKKSFEIYNIILEILIESIEENEALKKDVYIIQFIKYLKKKLKDFQKNKEITLNLMNLLNKFNLLEDDLIDELLFHPNEEIRIYTIGLLKRGNKTFKKLLPLLKKSENIRCEVLKKIPEDINPRFIDVLMYTMVNGTPRVRLTIINSLSDFDKISNLFIPMLKYALAVNYTRFYAIKLINKIVNADTSEIFITEFDKLNKNKNNRNFDTNYYISLIEAVSNSNNIDLFSLISDIFKGYFTPCFQYALDYIFNVADELNNNNFDEILRFLELHKNLIKNDEVLLDKVIKFLKKTKHYESISFLIDISADMKNIKLQYRVIDLLNHLPSEKQREILENINIELFKPRIQERLKLYKNNLRFKNMSDFFN